MLNNKNFVIIGGTTGLGFSAALAFIKNGAGVVVVGRSEESCEKAGNELGSKGIAISGDATHPDTAEKAIDVCIDKFGGFDGLYHVAGGSGRKMGDGPLHEITLEGWNYTLNLNLTSMMLSNRAAIRKFLDLSQPGVLLNMGSVLGYSPSPRYFATHAYAAAKSAVVGYSKSLASYYARNNIRVNVVAPGLVETPMAQRAADNEEILNFMKSKQPLDGGRIGNPTDLDGAVCYLMSEQSKFVTGQVLTVDGGWTISEGQYNE